MKTIYNPSALKAPKATRKMVFGLVLPPSLLARINERASELDVNRQELLRSAIERFLAESDAQAR